MASILPFPLSYSLEYNLFRQYVESDLSRLVLGPLFVGFPIPENLPFSTNGLSLMAEAIHLQSSYASKSSGKSLRTWPNVSDAYLAWLDQVEASYTDLWHEVGIYEAIQLSRVPSQTDNLLLAAALYFCSPTPNTFFFIRTLHTNSF